MTMADRKTYEYRVIEPRLPEPPRGETMLAAGEMAITFRSYGTTDARTPEEACEKIAEREELADRTTLVAVALSNWHEREVVVETLRQVSARKKAADPVEPELEVGDGAAGDVIDESLDPDAACETEDCGHLPRHHGSDGLGICRVKDCPCGAYTAPKAEP